MMYAAALAVVGYQAVLFALLSKVYALHEGFLPASARFRTFQGRLNLENIIVAGDRHLPARPGLAGVSSVLGGATAASARLDPPTAVRSATPALLGLVARAARP